MSIFENISVKLSKGVSKFFFLGYRRYGTGTRTWLMN
jgi:hypothetical protein